VLFFRASAIQRSARISNIWRKSLRNLPKINRNYWLSLVAASILGTNTGDFVAGRLHLGHLAGLPYLAALFAVILVLERRARHSAIYFWAAIITMRTAATNVGDAFHDFGIDFSASIPIVLVLFAASVFVYHRVSGETNTQASTVRVNPAYWVCMMLAGILGTIGGDYASFRLGLTPPGAALVFGLMIAASIGWFGKQRVLLTPVPYWFTVALIRTGGTAAGDALAHALKLPLSTAVTGFVFVALVLYFYGLQSTNEATRG
jgi:uncharacterized membrane-anchored protein